MDSGPVQSPAQWRHLFHSRPEPGWCEFWTTATLARALQKMGLEPKVGEEILAPEGRLGLPSEAVLQRAKEDARKAVGDSPKADAGILARMGSCTGLVVDFAPDKEPGVVIRCDIDALPVPESPEQDHAPAAAGFASALAGRSHACGHDGHMAIALTLAGLLAPHKDELTRNVRILFQPAEEGVRGAQSLTRWVEGWPCFLGYHIGLSCPKTGSLVTGVSGTFATTKFDVDFTGREAHAAQSPETGCDALKAAATALLAIHALPRDSRGDGRVCVGVCHGGSGRNIVPGAAHLECEVRGRTDAVNAALFHGAQRAAKAAADMYGVSCRISVRGAAAGMTSDPSLAALAAGEAAEIYEGQRRFFTDIRTEGTASVSEDAATLMRTVQQGGGKAAYMLFGSSLAAGHHEPGFDFDEAVLLPAAKLLARLVRRLAR